MAEWGVSGRGCLFLYSEWGWGGEGGVTKRVKECQTGWLRELKERECQTKLKWGTAGLRWGVRTEGVWVSDAEEWRNEGLGLEYRNIYIYIGYFCNFRCQVFNQAGSRVFWYNPNPTWTCFRFFFLKPIPDPIPNRTG